LSEIQPWEDGRIADPFLDRRSGDDRREAYDLDFFQQGGVERRSGIERRERGERRAQFVNISEWSSVCPKTNSPGE
jgi:hypothetical protein